MVLRACRQTPLHSKLNPNTSTGLCGLWPLTITKPHLIFHLHFISLFHILILEPESGSEQTSARVHQTPTWIYLLLYIYCRNTRRYSVRISTWFSQISLWFQVQSIALKSAASTPLDYLLTLSKPLLSMDSTPQSNLRASAQGWCC